MAPELVKNANELFCFVTLFHVFRLLLVEMGIFALHPFPALHTTFNLEVKPQTPNPKPQTPNPKPQTPNPKPQTPTPCCRLWVFKACIASKSFSSSACAIPQIGFKYFITPNYFIMFLRFYTLVRYLREREAVQVNRTSTPKIQTTFQFRLTFCHRCGPSEPSSTAMAW